MPCALVLSAGGMFGAYQAGAWKALAATLKPDLIVGASAGALNAWMIAAGSPPDDLIAAWLDKSGANVMRYRFPPWTLFDPEPLIRRVNSDFDRFHPKIPCGITMVEVPKLRRVLVTNERITPAHLRASCAIPFGYPPVRIDGKLYVDGGLLDVVPLWAAVEMGATRAVVINALPMMPSWVLRQAVTMTRRFGPAPLRFPNLDVVEIRPKATLGSVRDSIHWDERNIRRWIEQGEHDATQALKALACPSAG